MEFWVTQVFHKVNHLKHKRLFCDHWKGRAHDLQSCGGYGSGSPGWLTSDGFRTGCGRTTRSRTDANLHAREKTPDMQKGFIFADLYAIGRI